MPAANLIDRVALFYKETIGDGKKRIKRIPWDFISFSDDGDAPKSSGQFISPMPISFSPFSDKAVQAASASGVIADVQDMFYDDNQPNMIDDVVRILFVESENWFVAHNEGTTGYYDGDTTQSAEFGYPRVYSV